jgi:DNA-binding GntR family transcriptional regulator
MELVRVDTQRAYERIREKITTLQLAPGAQINQQALSEELDMGEVPIREALKLLVHDNLVVVTPRHGLYVSEVDLPELEQLSEIRLSFEGLSARLAAERATPDDLAVLNALRQTQEALDTQDSQRWFDLDHKFHQAVAQAAKNKYLARTLEHFFGLSQRLWYLVLPHLDFLPAAVEKHRDLVEAIQGKDPDRAEAIMRGHIQEFYEKVKDVIANLPEGDQESN